MNCVCKSDESLIPTENTRFLCIFPVFIYTTYFFIPLFLCFGVQCPVQNNFCVFFTSAFSFLYLAFCVLLNKPASLFRCYKPLSQKCFRWGKNASRCKTGNETKTRTRISGIYDIHMISEGISCIGIRYLFVG